MVEQENLEFTGTPVDVTEALISLSTGWNWIGYTPQVSLAINTALSNIGPDNATYIKSQSGFADYYSGYGWYGQLSDMDPFLGYQIYMVNEDNFTYPEGGGLVMASNRYKQDDRFSNLSWEVNPHDYEFNGSATIQVALDRALPILPLSPRFLHNAPSVDLIHIHGASFHALLKPFSPSLS